ncbi:MAG: YbaB/EbfC family nucleoid-associated protein [Saprospiraceae bacterium]|jgi:DNA-binding protein YbaB|nr:YbaB/EbfC family nucleoid-associated protein [Saprospiraceae bacterium]MDP4700291.1 YbaB/EbfC family nucleoid-associated protein [Saprospiraceae bacterium]MDP4810660.1 YbaB/EbfC family nucleoid-associated protein [Saprospiraceae bacterium]MDP4814818.1 YbaB/EbfC family nucleoid-associated protein [Saprospiraceae bacterium]MDP4915916.1 YbaB/EbfC family nucleoid-associated protein [Saprospiraceae bacterium]
MSKLIFDEMMEVQQSVLENLSNITIVAISDNQIIEVSADGNRNITNIHINEEMMKEASLSELESLLTLTVNKALEMSMEAEEREITRMMDAFSPALFDSLK